MRSLARRSDRGDTIIEVIFAIVIFAFVAISSFAIMNQGVATGEKALEITLVRQEVNAQAEALRFVHEAHMATPKTSTDDSVWRDIVATYGVAAASPYGVEDGACKVPTDTHKPFIMNVRTAQVWDGELTEEYDGSRSLPPYSQVAYSESSPTVVEAAYGIWIEAVSSVLSEVDDKGSPFVDFHIRACWPAPGSSVPMTIGTIVRLYDPA